MRQLNFDLKTLQARHREGAFLTRRDRAYALNQAANLLHALGFRRLRATGLKRKHVDALVAEWQRRGLATGTVKNRMSALRWWAERAGRPGVVGTNAAHGIGERRYVTNEDRSRRLDAQRLARVSTRADRTLRSVFAGCWTQEMGEASRWRNRVYACVRHPLDGDAAVYSDANGRADTDAARAER